MSRTYDDLKGAEGKGFDPEKDKPEPLDLFAYAASRQVPESVPESVSDPQNEPCDEEPVVEEITEAEAGSESDRIYSGYEDTPLFKSTRPSRQSLAGVIDPLTGIGGRRRKRISRGMVMILLLSGVVAIVVYVFLLRKDRTDYTSDTAVVEEALRTRPPEVSHSVPVPVAPQSQKREEVLPLFKDLHLKIPGAVIKTEGGVKMITFSQGLFVSGTRLGNEGQQALSHIAKQLSGYGGKLSITVIGCTDNTPLNKGSCYADNRALGLQRAQEVIRVLSEKGAFPRTVFHPLSYGERWSPYPNKTRADRARNRTAVLRISCSSSD